MSQNNRFFVEQSTENLNVKLDSLHQHTHFDEYLFHLVLKLENGKKMRHRCRLYRYWSFSSTLNIPNESSCFLKMFNRINSNNETQIKLPLCTIIPKDSIIKTKNYYLIHAKYVNNFIK